jgi:opacity protein-like surface antigen
MRTTNLVVLALCVGIASVQAQSPEQVLNSDPINVDGYLQDRPVTDGELEEIRNELKKQKMGTQLNKEKAKDLGKLTQQTEKLLESQDEYIDQKIESTQAIKEFNKKHEENQKKLRCIVEELNTAECEPYRKMSKKQRDEVVQEIKLSQAAPVVTAPAPMAPMSLGAFEAIKLLPYAGGTSYNSEAEQLDAELAMGLRIESNINSRFSLGIGLNFTQLKTEDFANPGFNYGPWYYQQFGLRGREMQYREMGLDLYGKFFITQGERFRPYLGAGLGLSRANLRYTSNENFNHGGFGNMYSFGDENFRTSFLSGRIMGGSEIMVTRNFGFNIEASYATGLGSGFAKQDAKNPFNSPDQARLRQLGNEIINANALSIFAGAVVVF